MKETFYQKNFHPRTKELLDTAIGIIENYFNEGYRLTLRQLYYVLVSKTIIPNITTEYNKLSGLIKDGRMCGLIDWNAIEDRIRIPYKHSEFDDLEDLIEAAINSYRLNRWKGQKNYVELWVEKDALSGVLKPIADKYHITLMVNRGYSSASAMYGASKRFINEAIEKENCILLYLGDFDPSGEDMVRDIEERQIEFRAKNVEIIKIALNPDQIKKYNPPPNPIKRADPRSRQFEEKYGGTCWEVDALEPKILHKLIEKEIEKRLNWEKMNVIISQEEDDKRALRDFVEEYLEGK